MYGLLFGIPMTLISSSGPLHESSAKRAAIRALVQLAGWIIVFTWYGAIAESLSSPPAADSHDQDPRDT